MQKLTQQNYLKGFLVDDSCMGGVSADPSGSGVFLAYLVDHLTGEVIDHLSTSSLDQALNYLNQMPRDWGFESIGGCGNCDEKTCQTQGRCKNKASCC